MRRLIVLLAAGALMGSCSGEAPEPRPDPEICDDGIDNDGDGDVDCDDSQCGGLPCLNQGDDDDDDTGQTGPPPTVEVLFDAETCCDFEFVLEPNCTQNIGEVGFINRSLEDDGDYDISCDQVGSGFPIQFQTNGAGQLQPFLANRPIDTETEVTISVIYNCSANQTFTTSCSAKVEAGNEDDEIFFDITGTLAQ